MNATAPHIQPESPIGILFALVTALVPFIKSIAPKDSKLAAILRELEDIMAGMNELLDQIEANHRHQPHAPAGATPPLALATPGLPRRTTRHLRATRRPQGRAHAPRAYRATRPAPPPAPLWRPGKIRPRQRQQL